MNQLDGGLRLKGAIFALLLSLSLEANMDGAPALKALQTLDYGKIQNDLKSGNLNRIPVLSIEGYAEASNNGFQSILGGSLVSFDTVTGPHTTNITPPSINGTTFHVIEAGTYLIMFHVRGTPDQLTPPHPLIFDVTANGTPIGASQFAADNQTTSLSSLGTEQVNGFVIATLPAHAAIQLRNITNSGTSVVTLHASTTKAAVVNAAITILRLAGSGIV